MTRNQYRAAFRLALLLFAFMASADTTAIAKIYPLGKSSGALLGHGYWDDSVTVPIISIGPGIETVTFSLDSGNVGVFNIFMPLNVTFNLYQKIYYQSNGDEYDFCLWAPSVGFLVEKPSGQNAAVFGVSVVPYQIKINKFAFGIGAAWVCNGRAGFQKSNFSIALPLTYSVDIGN